MAVGGTRLRIAGRSKVRYWDQVASIILLIPATMAIIDWIGRRIRRRRSRGESETVPRA